jgi:hypothetical protein
MKKEAFASLLRKAGDLAVEAATSFVSDDLPRERRFFLNLNTPYEELKPTEKSFPELEMKRWEYLGPKTEAEIVEHLWISGAVPVWIDISVYRTVPDFTFLDLLACNRFSSERSDYAYEDRNLGPFVVKSPVFPPGWRDSMGRFRLQDRVDRFHHLRVELP